MKEYQVKILNADGSFKEELHTFQLKDKAIVEDLKKAFSEVDLYVPNQLRMSYKTAARKLRKYQNDVSFLTIFKMSFQPLRMMTVWMTLLANMKMETLLFNVPI